MTQVDQIMIRKVGGWNMVRVSDWTSMPLAERDSLVADDAVQFFADGTVVETMEALASISPEMGAAGDANEPNAATASSEAPAVGDISELMAATLVTATYSRQVITGPAWQVTRAIEDQDEVPFSEVRNHPNDDVYDLSSPQGTLTLIADLMTDVFGHTGDSTTLISTQAAMHFDETYFSSSLGDRFWQVTAQDIRAQVAKNPYIRLLNNV